MSLAFLSKKSFHPCRLDNAETIWIRERNAAEQRCSKRQRKEWTPIESSSLSNGLVSQQCDNKRRCVDCGGIYHSASGRTERCAACRHEESLRGKLDAPPHTVHTARNTTEGHAEEERPRGPRQQSNAMPFGRVLGVAMGTTMSTRESSQG